MSFQHIYIYQSHPNQQQYLFGTANVNMQILVVLCASVALAAAKPYSFTAMAPLSSMNLGIMPYSIWGAHPMAYSAMHAPLVHTAPVMMPAVGVKSQYHAQDIIGQASYGHMEPLQSHSAVHDAAGNKVGSFSYVKPDGSVARTDYVADAMGYRVASNDLPVAPIHTAMPVADTPEVMAARMAHLAEVEKVKSRSRRQAILPASTSPLVHHIAPLVHTPLVHSSLVHTPVVHAPLAYSYPWSHNIPVVTSSGHLADTPEVASAKIAHFAEHAKAAYRGKRQVLYTNPIHSTYSNLAINPLIGAQTIPLTYSATHLPLTTHHNLHYTW